ncbi:hypothetical protein CLW00_102124 [Mongoliibacter ruber]|uniref:Uncharacterized protein n=1 Tax=Mongoliibacter ruber TaxID=1750599 RepID=A0A2T0WSH6_9BACT|nr:hypothetical protein CLW00_102124 [Mongoliibacter ruber]
MTRKRAEKRDTRFCVLRVKCLSQNLTFSLGFHLRLSADSAGGKIVPQNTQNFAEPPVPDLFLFLIFYILLKEKIRALKSVSLGFHLRLSVDSAGGKIVPQNTQNFAEPLVPDFISISYLLYLIERKDPSLKVC